MSRLWAILLLTLVVQAGAQTQGELSLLRERDTIKPPSIKEIDMLAPSKAAFYSAILPGLGQAYNKKYWKIPIVYGAMGTSIYFYLDNNKKYHRYRDAYKRRLAGFTDDEFSYLDNGRLIQAQRFYQRNRDLSMLITGRLLARTSHAAFSWRRANMKNPDDAVYVNPVELPVEALLDLLAAAREIKDGRIEKAKRKLSPLAAIGKDLRCINARI